MKKAKLPVGWSAKRVASLATKYEKQSEPEAVAEDEAQYKKPESKLVRVPVELVPKVRSLIAKHKSR